MYQTINRLIYFLVKKSLCTDPRIMADSVLPIGLIRDYMIRRC